jgi:hypothetical protein
MAKQIQQRAACSKAPLTYSSCEHFFTAPLTVTKLENTSSEPRTTLADARVMWPAVEES